LLLKRGSGASPVPSFEGEKPHPKGVAS
jgi:hypothetical protein